MNEIITRIFQLIEIQKSLPTHMTTAILNMEEMIENEVEKLRTYTDPAEPETETE